MAATPGCPRLTARLIRWLGLGSNPLRRASDRAEAWIRVGLLAVFLITGPLAAPAAGGWVSHLYVAAVSARAAHAHAVRAILLQPDRAAAGLTMAGRATAVWVTARWDSSGGPPRTGEVSAPAGSPAGTVVTVWLDPSGTVIGPSPPDTQADDAVPVAAATLVVMACWVCCGWLSGCSTRGAWPRGKRPGRRPGRGGPGTGPDPECLRPGYRRRKRRQASSRSYSVMPPQIP